MAIIYSYPEKQSPSGGDFLVITDSEQPAPNKNRTKSLKLSDLSTFVLSSETTYDLTGTASLSDYKVVLTGSDGTVDNIVFEAGTGITLADQGTNTVQIQAINNGTVTGTGTLNTLTKWNAAGTGIQDSIIFTSGDGSNVGIGLPAFVPERTLDVRGVIRATNSGQAFRAESNVSNGLATIEFENGDAVFRLRNRLSSDTVKIKSAGNSFINGGSLGIGVEDGSAKFTVAQGGSTPAAKITNTNSNGVGLVVSRGISNTADLQRWQDINNDIKSVVDSDGKIGINVTNPARELDVKGSIRTTRPDTANGYAHIALNNEFKAASGIYFENKSAQLLLKKDNAPLNGELNVKISSNTDSYVKGGRFGVGATLATARTDSKLYVKNGDIQIDRPDNLVGGGGLVLQTPDGTKRYKITIDNAGNVVSTQV